MSEELEQKKTEDREALEAVTVEIEAEPLIIPKEAVKMKVPTWAKVSMIVTGVLVLVYGIGLIYFSNHFMWNSSLNGMDVSLLSQEQARNQIETMVQNYQLEILERDGVTEWIAGSDIDLEYQFLGTVQGVLRQQKPYLWFIQGFQQKNYTMDAEVTYDVVKLYEEIHALDCMQKENITEPVEPQIIRTLGTFRIQEGVIGKKPIAMAVKKEIREAVSGLEAVVDLEQANCYAGLEYEPEDEEILNALEYLEKLQKVEITYQFPDAEETLTGEEILEWVTISEDYTIHFDRSKAEEYINYLKENYEMRGQKIHFQTSLDKTVEVTSYMRSSEMETSAEVEELFEMLEKAQESKQTEFVRDSADIAAIGDTYIEINLTSQHLYCYKDGEMILETDMVSGKPSTGCATPPGVFTIRYTSSPAILVGENYRTPVSYWMPFNGGIGLHDATWQSAFGGSRYINYGSHGCINLPLDVAKEIYNNYGAGDVVVLYHLAGTEQGTASPAVRPSSSPVIAATEAPEPPASDTESVAPPTEPATEAASTEEITETEASTENTTESSSTELPTETTTETTAN